MTFPADYFPIILQNIPTISSPLRPLITYVYGTGFLKFFDYNYLFWGIWSVAFCKNILVFWYSHMTTSFEFRIFVIILNTTLSIRYSVFDWTSASFIWLFYDMCYYICQLFDQVYQYLHFLIQQSNACTFCSSRFW